MRPMRGDISVRQFKKTHHLVTKWFPQMLLCSFSFFFLPSLPSPSPRLMVFLKKTSSLS